MTAVLAMAGCLFKVWSIRWICDDIFITLRYVDHFFRGMGVVFNPGEYVEGYTHPLWLWVLAAVKSIGTDPVVWCVNLGILFCAVVMACAVIWSWRLNPKTYFYLPYTALVLLLHFDFQVWATSGMETMLFAALLASAFTIYFFTSLGDNIRLVLTGFLLTAAVATRPDGALFYILANSLIAGRIIAARLGVKRALGQLLLFNASCLILFVPYLIWKTSYYGHLLPNTFYAKSGGGLIKWAQGVYFLSTYFRAYFSSLLIVVPMAMALALILREFKSHRSFIQSLLNLMQDRSFAATLTALLGIVIYVVVFIVRSGGDFMYARFLVPLMPFMYFSIEWAMVRIFSSRPKALLLATALLPACLIIEVPLRDNFLKPPDETYESFMEHRHQTRGVNDEYWYYTAPIFLGNTMNAIEAQRFMGETLRPYLEGTDASMLLIGHNALAYYAKAPYAIEYFGLTDETIARTPSKLGHDETSFIGHERKADPDYLLERGLDIMSFKPEDHHESWRRVRFLTPNETWLTAVLMTYDRDLWDGIKARWGERVQFIPFTSVLDDYIRNQLPNADPHVVERDYRRFNEFYFLHNQDDAREQPFIRFLMEHGLLGIAAANTSK